MRVASGSAGRIWPISRPASNRGLRSAPLWPFRSRRRSPSSLKFLFFQSNSKLDGVRSFSGFTSNVAVSVVEIPVLVKFDLSAMKMPDGYVVAGPAVGFIASAKQKDIKFGSQTESDDDLKANNEVESTVFGVVFGAGFTRGSWGVEVRYDLGLTNTAHNKPGEDASLKNGTVTGLFRWYFPHK